METFDFQVGDKVKFNEETKKKFQIWLESKDNRGHELFCREIKQFDLNGYFTVAGIDDGIGNDSMRIILKELPEWYFGSSEFIKD